VKFTVPVRWFISGILLYASVLGVEGSDGARQRLEAESRRQAEDLDELWRDYERDVPQQESLPEPRPKTGGPPPPIGDITTVVRRSLRSVGSVKAYDRSGRSAGQGSGFVVRGRGFVVTNYHVIEGASRVEIELPGGYRAAANTVLAFDCAADIAILQPQPSFSEDLGLPLASSAPNIGEPVLTIGGPLGIQGTVSDGIVSGLRRRGDTGIRVVQTTAPVSPGNSGGPLLNHRGEVIGVIAFFLAAGQNLNFAISAEHLRVLQENRSPEPVARVSRYCPSSRHETSPLAAITGTYQGLWRSNVFNASGDAVVTIMQDGEDVVAKLFLTGSPIGYGGDFLRGTPREVGSGVWVAQLVALNSGLSVKAVFSPGKLSGDYLFSRGLAADRGRWILSK
jgi:hypothetical protein